MVHLSFKADMLTVQIWIWTKHFGMGSFTILENHQSVDSGWSMYNALTLEQSQTNKNVYSIFIMIFSEFLEGAGHGFWEYLEKKKSTA